MIRTRAAALDDWIGRPDRKPLILRGARQVGKTWLVREWGRGRFREIVEANLERRPELHGCFADNDPRLALRRLEVVLGRAVPEDGSALLFLDEVQAAPHVLSKLRWFAEEIPALPVIAAGSLLDFALADPAFSMPVGRVTFLHLEPMGLTEFCLALGEERLADWLAREVTAEAVEAGEAVPAEIHGKASRLFRQWVLIGGMPAAVEAFRLRGSYAETGALQRDLLASLRDDFAKYSGRADHRRLLSVLASVPRQLGSKFTWRAADPDDRAEPLRRALDLLCLARVCHGVRSTPAAGVPLGAGADDRFLKVLHLDIGLASTDLGLSLPDVESAADVTLVNRGAIAEQAVGQLLRLCFPANCDPALFWWRRDRAGSQAEVDYVLAHGSRVVPVEVKAGASGRLRSLHLFMGERGLGLAVRVSSAPPVVQPVEAVTSLGARVSYRLLSIPAYLTEHLPRLLDALL